MLTKVCSNMRTWVVALFAICLLTACGSSSSTGPRAAAGGSAITDTQTVADCPTVVNRMLEIQPDTSQHIDLPPINNSNYDESLRISGLQMSNFLDLGGLSLHDACLARVIADLLVYRNDITSIELQDNKLTIAGVKALFMYMKENNHNITRVGIVNNSSISSSELEELRNEFHGDLQIDGQYLYIFDNKEVYFDTGISAPLQHDESSAPLDIVHAR